MFDSTSQIFSSKPDERATRNVLNLLGGRTANSWIKTGGANRMMRQIGEGAMAAIPGLNVVRALSSKPTTPGLNVVRALFSKPTTPTYKPANMSFGPRNMTPAPTSLPRNYQMLVQAGVPRPHRNNNPLNIKESAYTRAYNGVVNVDPYPASDGGHFLIFDTVKSGFDGAKRLLSTEGYMRLSVDQAMKRWSNSGYGGEILPAFKNKMMAALTEAEKDLLVRAMAKREGYKGA